MTLKNVGIVLAATMVSSLSMAQKNKVTDAALEYQKVDRLIATQDFDNAEAVLNTAKEYIDESYTWAKANPDAKKVDKIYYYKGLIYGKLPMVDVAKNGENANEENMTAHFNTAREAYDEGYEIDGKYKRDIEEAVRQSAGLLGFGANQAYEAKEFGDAGEAYEMAGDYFMAIDVFDSSMYYNAGLCYRNAEMFKEGAEMFEKLAAVNYRGATAAALAASCHLKLGDFDKARTILNEARKTDPNNTELLTQLVNVSLEEGDNERAMKALDDAIAADPNNAALHYSIGTIHMNLENYEAAEISLRKSLEIDPKNVNTLYQLGAHLYNWSGNLTLEANNLSIGDPNVAKLKSTADEKMKEAIVILEKYLESEPNDKYVLDTLYRAYHKQGNTEKSKEYKARLDAL